MRRLKKILVFLSQSYSLDPRALSLMRIALALVIIADLCIRSSDLSAFYTNEGLLPVDDMYRYSWKSGYWSIHAFSGSYAWVLWIFILHFVFAFFLLIGYRTRLSALLVLILYISLHNRNLFINQSGDDLIRLVLLWGLFLPWNFHYSIDARRLRIQTNQFPLANFAFLFLLSSIYFFTVTMKSGEEWRESYTAIYYALSLEQIRIPITGDWLYEHPALMKIFTAAVYYMELFIPFLLLFPSKKGRLRLIAFFLLVILHAGIGFSLYVGLFFLINIAAAFGLLPPFAMNFLERKFSFLRRSSGKIFANRPVKAMNPLLKISGNVIIGFLIILNLMVNLGSVSWFRYELADFMKAPVHVLKLDQYWGMFSPNILKREGWFVYFGIDSIGRQWDVRRNEDYVSFEKPGKLFYMHKSDRWRKLTEQLQRDDMGFLKVLYCQYTLRDWNKKHPEKKLKMLQLFYMQKESLPEYKTTEVEKKLLCICNER